MNIRSLIFSISLLIFSGIYFLEAEAIKPELQAKLNHAILNDSIEEVQQALKLGADINFPKDNKPPLLLAILLKRSNIVKYLLESGVRVNVQFIEHAVKARESELAAQIAKKCRADLNAIYSGYTLMHLAMNCGDYRTVIWLINNGANFNENFLLQNMMGGSGYSYPDASIIFELFKTLINNGYPVNNLWHSSIWGSFNDYTEKVIQLLIKHGASPNYIFHLNQSQKTYSTPLMKAVSSFNLAAVKTLLNLNANINQKAYGFLPQSNKLHTPLSLAIEFQNITREPLIDPIIKLLIEHKGSL